MRSQICTKCNKEQCITEFRKDQHHPTGYHPHCRTCFNFSQKEYRAKNKSSLNSYANAYYKKNADRIKAMRKLRKEGKSTEAFHSKNKVFDPTSYSTREGWKKRKAKTWKHRGILNMTYEKYEEMLKDQDYKCAICSKDHTDSKKLHVDHCHVTGKARGLLCNNCNNGMGKLGDSIERLKNTIKYLEKNT